MAYWLGFCSKVPRKLQSEANQRYLGKIRFIGSEAADLNTLGNQDLVCCKRDGKVEVILLIVLNTSRNGRGQTLTYSVLGPIV